MSEHDEILRLRDRMHDVGGELAALHHQVSDLHRSRAELQRKLDELGEQVGRMARADDIADAVAARVNAANTLRLTTAQRLLGAAIGLTSLATALKVLVGL